MSSHPGPKHNARALSGFKHLELLSSVSVIFPTLLIVLAIAYQHFVSRNRPLPAPHKFLGRALISAIPARVLVAVDRWTNPPLFPVPPLGRVSVVYTHAEKAEMVRRILGAGRPGSLMSAASQVGRRGWNPLSGNPFSFKGGDQPAGLGNIDNSCYQNSILQGLTALETLPDYLGLISRPEYDPNTTRTTDTLRDLIVELKDPANNGKTLWTPWALKNMSTWSQQDAQEYYSKLIDEVEKEVARAVKSIQMSIFLGLENEFGRDDSESTRRPIPRMTGTFQVVSDARKFRNPVEGLTAQRVACVACGYADGIITTPFNCLTLSLGNSQSEHTLHELMDSYVGIELIENVECAKCTLIKFRRLMGTLVERNGKDGKEEKVYHQARARLQAIQDALEEGDFKDATLAGPCKIPADKRVNSTKTKQTVIARSSPSLVIHMNRSVFDERTGDVFKNIAPVSFPKHLDLGPYLLGSAGGGSGAGSVQPDFDEPEVWHMNPRSSMAAGCFLPSRITGPIYELRAVVVHFGNHENGHYVCYRKHPAGERPDFPPLSSDDPPRLAAEEQTTQLLSDGATHSNRMNLSCAVAAAQRRVETDIEPPDVASTWQWWRLSDRDVMRVEEETVLWQRNVFMLFYDCVNPSQVRIGDETAVLPAVRSPSFLAESPLLQGRHMLEEDAESSKDVVEASATDGDETLNQVMDAISDTSIASGAASVATPISSTCIAEPVKLSGEYGECWKEFGDSPRTKSPPSAHLHEVRC